MNPDNLQDMQAQMESAMANAMTAGAPAEEGFFTVANILSIQNVLYVIAALFFVFGIKGLTHPRTAVKGNLKAFAGMIMAMVIVLLAFKGNLSVWPGWYLWVIGIVIGGLIGFIAAKKVAMTEMPEMVALFNGSGGLASMLVAGAVFMNYYFKAHGSPLAETEGFDLARMMGLVIMGEGASPTQCYIATVASGIIGAVTTTGSVLAFLKLRGKFGDAV